MDVVLGGLNGVFLSDLLEKSRASSRVIRAAVAYAQPNHPLFDFCRKESDVRLVFYGLLDEEGAVSPVLLRNLLNLGPSRADCRLLRGNFHAKVIWWQGYGAYIGSANLTHKAWFNNVECGVFYSEKELSTLVVRAQLALMFEHLHKHSVALTDELVKKLELLAVERRGVSDAKKKAKERFDTLFSGVPLNPGLTTIPAKGVKRNTIQEGFVQEWADTLQKLRGLSAEFGEMNLRPSWVASDAHPAIHFDQFLHAYYYEYVRGGLGEDNAEDDSHGVELVEHYFERNKALPKKALAEAAKWWSNLAKAPYDEDEFIRSVGPGMSISLSKSAIAGMDAESFRKAIRRVNAFRMHARQIRNDFFGLPANHSETLEERVDRLAEWLWTSPDARTKTGKSVQDVLSFVVWGDDPSDMEQRLWLSTDDPNWKIPHFAKSMLGEAVGWARPSEYPPRNNRTNKALRALGHDVRLFG